MSEIEHVQATVPARSAEREAHALLHAALMAYDDDRAALAEAGDVDALAWGMARLRDLRLSFAALLDAVEQDVARLMPDRLHDVEGLGILERRKAKKRTEWDHRGVAKAVLEQAWEAGDINSPTDVVDLLLKVAGVGYWKVTELRPRGIDSADFCREEPGRTTVMVHNGGEAEL